MPLFKMELALEVVVEADDAEAAMAYATSHGREMLSDWNVEPGVAREVKHLSDLPAGWDGLCFPYGDKTAVEAQRLRNLLPT